MAKSSAKVETAPGQCSEHGQVQGVREVPRPHFPFIVYLVQRVMAGRAPYTCPQCGENITPD